MPSAEMAVKRIASWPRRLTVGGYLAFGAFAFAALISLALMSLAGESRPGTALLVALAAAAIVMARALRISAEVTLDTVVIRNVFRTYRLDKSELTSIRLVRVTGQIRAIRVFRMNQRRGVTVMAAGPEDWMDFREAVGLPPTAW